MSPLNVGVIGLGVGEQHLIGLEAHEDCRVVGISDIDEVKLEEVGARHSEVPRFASPEALIESEELDMVVIASYDDAHYDQVVRAVCAGKHVFVEKPLCTQLPELVRIGECLDEHPGVRLSTNTVLRKSPRFRELHASIRAGDLGRIYYLEADYNYGRLEKLTNGWRGRSPGYSVMLGGGVHMVDLALWLTDARAEECYAIGNRICSEGTSYDGNDMVLANIRMEDETIVKVSANFGCVYPHFHRVSVYGTDGTFVNGMDFARRYKSRNRAIPPDEITSPYPGVPKHALLPSFVDAVLGRGRAEIEERDVFETMRVCFAIEKSLSEGRPVKMREIPGGREVEKDE